MKTHQPQGLSRRDFLRWSGATVAVLVVVACAPSAPATQTGSGDAGAVAPAAEKLLLRMQVDPEQEQPESSMYRAANPNIDFEFVSVTGIDHEEVAAELTMVASGQALDLGFAATEATQLYAGQKLAAC